MKNYPAFSELRFGRAQDLSGLRVSDKNGCFRFYEKEVTW